MKELICKHCREKIMLVSYLGELKWFHVFPTIQECNYGYDELHAEPNFLGWGNELSFDRLVEEIMEEEVKKWQKNMK